MSFKSNNKCQGLRNLRTLIWEKTNLLQIPFLLLSNLPTSSEILKCTEYEQPLTPSLEQRSFLEYSSPASPTPLSLCSLKTERGTNVLLKTKHMGGGGKKKSMEICKIKLWNYLIKQDWKGELKEVNGRINRGKKRWKLKNSPTIPTREEENAT